MVIETNRLIIRDVRLPDGEVLIHMASDGSLNDVGFDKDCSSWMDNWIIEAIKAYVRYFFEHYDENGIIATIREDNLPSWKAIEKAGFSLTERKMYKDINDANEELYRFYSMHKS